MRAILDFIVRILYFIVSLVFHILNLITVIMFNGCTVITVGGVVIKLFLKPELIWMDIFRITLTMLVVGGISWVANLLVATIKNVLEEYIMFS